MLLKTDCKRTLYRVEVVKTSEMFLALWWGGEGWWKGQNAGIFPIFGVIGKNGKTRLVSRYTSTVGGCNVKTILFSNRGLLKIWNKPNLLVSFSNFTRTKYLNSIEIVRWILNIWFWLFWITNAQGLQITSCCIKAVLMENYPIVYQIRS